MRTSIIFPAILSATALVACSGGQGPGSSADSNPPPPPPPASPPSPPPAATPSPTPTPVGTLVCSPCKKIVFMSNSEIYTANVDGTGLARLTENNSYDGEPAWSPDGQRIAFTSDRDFDGSGLWRNELYVMDADGDNVTRMTFSKSGAWRPAWSPDGARIAYETMSEGSGNLWEVPAAGGTPKMLFSSPGIDGQPAWSPDGTRLALVSDWFAYDFVTDIFLINVDGSGFTAVTDGNIFDQVDYEDPAWSPDGSRIAMTISERLGTFNYVTRLALTSPNGSDIRLLPVPGGASSDGVRVGKPSWSPDGTTIAYTSCGTSRCDVAWVSVDGSARGEIILNGEYPDWQR